MLSQQIKWLRALTFSMALWFVNIPVAAAINIHAEFICERRIDGQW
jgi:hypothetical protein